MMTTVNMLLLLGLVYLYKRPHTRLRPIIWAFAVFWLIAFIKGAVRIAETVKIYG